MTGTTTIGFAGDVMLGRGVDRAQADRPPEAVWGDLHPRLQALDGFVCNLECCLSTRGTPWRETYHPFHFRADPAWAVPALETIGCRAVGLANNHALDFGPVALRDTLDALDRAGIAVAGVGETETAAFEPVVVSIGSLEVGLVAVTDNTPEFAAGPDSLGVAYVDLAADPNPPHVEDAIEQAEAAAPDLLVASVHLGPNMVTEPAERFRSFNRWLVDQGVDLVLGHSAHVFQGVEVHDGAPIIYDAGDFVDDYAVDPARKNDRGFLFELDLLGDRPQTLRLVPTEIEDYAVQQAPEPVAEWSTERMARLSAPFGTAFTARDGTLVLDL